MKPKTPELPKPKVDPISMKNFINPEDQKGAFESLVNTAPSGLKLKANTAKKTITGA